MKRIRIYSAQLLTGKQEVDLDCAASHHLGKVLRCKVGDELRVFDGSGSEYRAVIVAVGKKTLRIKLLGCQQPLRESPLSVELGQGISRGERMDYVLQKAVELGVSSVTPLFTERCNVKLDQNRVKKRMQHWQGVMLAACEQSGRVRVPRLCEPRQLAAWIEAQNSDLKWVCAPHAAQFLPPQGKPQKISVVIGPEGGLTETEIAACYKAGFSGLRLGPRVLRTETAAVVALSVLQFCYGDI